MGLRHALNMSEVCHYCGSTPCHELCFMAVESEVILDPDLSRIQSGVLVNEQSMQTLREKHADGDCETKSVQFGDDQLSKIGYH